MTNAHSKIYSQSTLPSTRRYTASVSFIDAGGDDIKKLIGDENNVSHAITINIENEATPLFCPHFADKEEDDMPDVTNFYILGNACDEIPSKSLLKATSTSCGNFLVLVPQDKAGRIGVDLETKYRMPVAKLVGTKYEGKKNILFLAPPSVAPMAYGVEPISGPVKSSAVQQSFKKLGPEYDLWIKLVVRAIDEKEDIAKVLDRMSTSDKEAYILNWDTVEENPNGPYTIFSPLNLSTLDEESDLYSKASTIMKEFNPPPTVPDDGESGGGEDGTSSGSGNPSGGTTPRDGIGRDDFLKLVDVMENRLQSPDAKGNKLRDAESKTILKGWTIMAEICWETGTIIGKPMTGVLTPAVNEAFNHSSTGRAEFFRRYIETSMEPPIDQDELTMNVLLQDMALVYFSPTLAAHLLKGNICKTPADSLIEAGKGFDLLSLASQRNTTGKINLLRASDMQKIFERDFETPDCHREKVSVTVERPGALECLPDLESLISNTITVTGLIALPKLPAHPKMKAVLTDCFRKIYVLIKSGPFKGWWDEMLRKQPQAVIVFFLRLDSIWCQIACIALHSGNMKLIEGNKADQIIKDPRLRAVVRTTFVFCQKVEDKILLKGIFTEVPRITPDNVNPELQAAKVQKNTENTSTVKSRGNGNGGGSAPKDTTPTSNRNRKPGGGVVAADTPKKESIEMGFLDPGQDCTIDKIFGQLKLTDTNTALPCYDYHAKGRVCSRKNCKYLHGSFLKFTNEWQTTILQSMLDNKCARLNADLKNSKKYNKIVGDKYAALWDQSFGKSNDADDIFSSMLLDQTIKANSYLVDTVQSRQKTSNGSGTRHGGEPPNKCMDVEPLPLPKIKPDEVDQILDDYQKKYAPNQAKHIVASMQGEPSYHNDHQCKPSRQQLYSTSNMKPRSTAQFRVLDLTLDEVILVLIHPSSRDFLCHDSWRALSCLDKGYNRLLRDSKRLESVDFSSLREPRLDYREQTAICEHRVDMHSACFFHYKGDAGLLIRYIGNEYTGAHRNVDACLERIKPHIDEDDFKAIERILRTGCPKELDYEIPKKAKMKMIARGNQKTLLDHMDVVTKTMNKEERHSHIVPVYDYLCRFGPACQHIPQGMNLKNGQQRLISDGSTKIHHDDIVLNEFTKIDDEPPITFGQTKRRVLSYLWNTRISYPNEEILCAVADIKACFRYPRFNPDVAGVFGFIINEIGHYYLSPAGVFGWKGSANVWEPFARAIQKMTAVVFDELTDEDDPHGDLINLLNWDPPPAPDQKFVQAVPDELNTGVLDMVGRQKPIPSHMFVDDNFLLAMIKFMRRLLNAIIEAIFIVMGRRDDTRRQCHLALDKWIGMTVSHSFVFIGLKFDTRRMTVGITDKYRDELIELIDKPWHKTKKTFDANELQQLIGKVARIGEACRWIFYLLPHLYASVNFALKSNKNFLLKSSPSFQKLWKSLKEMKLSDIAEANFAMKNAAHRVHKSTKRYYINETMRDEIYAIREIINPVDGVPLESAIAHMVKRSASGRAHSDSCMYGTGGFSTKYRFWFHLLWPEEVFKQTTKFVKGKGAITINDLEFIGMILDFIAALVAIETDGLDPDDEFPVILLFADNTSAVSWMTKFCLTSLVGRAIGRMLCFLLIDSPLGINAKWVAGLENTIADVISRLKEEELDEDGDSNFDYACLKQKFPQLKDCRQFLPSTELLSCLWRVVLTKKSPTLKELRQLRRQGLGKLIS